MAGVEGINYPIEACTIEWGGGNVCMYCEFVKYGMPLMDDDRKNWTGQLEMVMVPGMRGMETAERAD